VTLTAISIAGHRAAPLTYRDDSVVRGTDGRDEKNDGQAGWLESDPGASRSFDLQESLTVSR
jgi:hypothetical protein